MLSRTFNLFIFALAICAIGIETNAHLHSQLQPWLSLSSTERIVFYYSFFTVLSNLIFAFSCIILCIKPRYRYPWFKVFRLAGLIGVIITGIIYNWLLRPIPLYVPTTPILQFTNECLHVVLPTLALLTWLIWGPFYKFNFKTILSAFCYLLVYGIYIFTRGYFTGKYPYPFINVSKIGYEKALEATAGFAILFFALAFLLFLIERIRYKFVF